MERQYPMSSGTQDRQRLSASKKLKTKLKGKSYHRCRVCLDYTSVPNLIAIHINRQINPKNNRSTGLQRHWPIDRPFLSLDQIDRLINQLDKIRFGDGVEMWLILAIPWAHTWRN